ncbi:Cys/Met metabolism PLP-dependent enzyme-domain-containing protein [Coniella lustricola]|uniref:Cys/Met metabolism PLP-dependent enzyme-domain-containing protein n=1 Tax=Coniella lustricola TaxID=2025994 RepID=A0A2T2ZSZ8_9PEZI|nr:Cys/Met metabolism PLP-dependent enzyme-domain-containing protein [Coniella lustricola]
MPIRNPFTRRQADGGGLRPSLTIEPALKTPPGFERVDTVGSKASSAVSISSRRSQDTGEYKMSVESICRYPSPTEDKASWPRRYLSRNSTDTRSEVGDIEPFGISRESFDSYRRSFRKAKAKASKRSGWMTTKRSTIFSNDRTSTNHNPNHKRSVASLRDLQTMTRTPASSLHPASTGPDSLTSHFPSHTLSLSSLAVHGDDYINTHRAVAPPLHTSTTFRYSNDPAQLKQWDNTDPLAPHDSHIYSRDTAPNTTRLEALLSAALGGPSLTYASGLAAFHALLVYLNPRRVAIGGGYHGCHGVIALVAKLTGLEKLDLEKEADLDKLERGDLIHVETPLNPTGEARNLEFYAAKARETGCWLSVDATFAPPPLLEPFRFGVHVVLHSGTKYFGGHSDMLCGVLAVHPDLARTTTFEGADGSNGGDFVGVENQNWIQGLRSERLVLGSVMGSLEGWLGVRSLRTLEIRVQRQSESATRLVEWLATSLKDQQPFSDKYAQIVSRMVDRVQHASLQPEASDPNSWLRRQMPRGWGPVFSIVMRREEDARRLPSKLHLLHHATSIGGVESLIEWRAMSDKSVARTVLRVSVGVEAWEDLREDFLQAFCALWDERGDGEGA